jgi:glycosyltransferase involved in cell wall biosynthesis
MRVLFVNSRLDSQLNPGGDSIQVQKTQAALENLGVSVQVCNPLELEHAHPYDIAHIFNIQEPWSTWDVFQILRRNGRPIVLSPIYWEVLGYWYELAIANSGRWKSLTRFLGKRRVSKMYVEWQRRKEKTSSRWKHQKRLLEDADCVLPNSSSEADLLRRVFSLPNDSNQKIHIVPNGVDAHIYAQPPKQSDDFIGKYGIKDFLLQVGTINPVKNQRGLIEALIDSPVPIVFVGQAQDSMPEYAQACRALAYKRGNVLFIDRVNYSELPGVYALAAVHVLPSWRETPGLVSLEAGASGCRVVSTSIGSAKDYFGDMAWYCRPDDLYSIKSAVESALQAQPTDVLRKVILSKYTWDQAAMASKAAYDKVLSVAR